VDRHYSWDSTVPNHARPEAGDLCVVRDSGGALGFSRIERLERTEGVTKSRLRCPRCDRTAIKSRVTVRPRYRCAACGNEFPRARTERLEVTVYRADYAVGWVGIDGAVTVAALETVCLSRSKQHAIRQLDPGGLRKLLIRRHVSPVPRSGTSPASAGDRELGGGRRRAESLQRIGQAGFRRRLLERFGAICLISGPQPVESLHAAHVYRFADDPQHDLAGGLLLRADLHALFDAGLIDLDDRLRVVVDATLDTYPEIARYKGRRIRVDPKDPFLPALRSLLAKREAVLV
jgi:ribosomal protein L37AE/L43A